MKFETLSVVLAKVSIQLPLMDAGVILEFGEIPVEKCYTRDFVLCLITW
jgi:hypothetical protein